MKSLIEFGEDYIDQLQEGLGLIDLRGLEEAATRIRACTGTIWLIGNGGSASLASHMATDLQLARVRAIALTDVAAITTYTNDIDFSHSFESQLNVLAKPGDILIALSGSGNSGNILNACELAMARGVYVIGLSGFDGGKMKRATSLHLHLHAPCSQMGQVQDLEQVMLHLICYWLMEAKKT